ncbi:heme ABC transporter ATP-binding protein [Actibacterium sp. 188UL27-1]|uniref:heme ABC transporter ATP-binding protein n=1 Tax=Actibacterium sp. 188UL27-1 TaxID=2786961 RepID=UPI00195DC590|nr:heme ABC transporter ATP-binding protein [Actibacterium sp. 188UL27-1]MBM7067090.1 heme ABC transporter ATP-binding protein [Actibacterium sp. 188UL27-1]
MLMAHNISVHLGHRSILSDVTFSAKAGELTAIVGPNGSGKTTLLRALTGDVAYTGQITINDRALPDHPPWELATIRAVLPQATVLAFPFTVIEVVRIGLHSGVSGGRDDVALHALHRVGLGSYVNRVYQELSGGEQQRVQLARVLAQVWDPVMDGTPRWLLLDEPVASLDIGHQLGVMDIAQRYAQSGGGVVAIMHDLNLTALYADRVAILSNGRVLADGTVSDVLTDTWLSRAYGCDIRVNTPPAPGKTYILPHAATIAVHRKLVS